MRKYTLACAALVTSLIIVCPRHGYSLANVIRGVQAYSEDMGTGESVSKKKPQTIKGPMTYNLYKKRNPVTFKLLNSAYTDLSYAIVEGTDIAELNEDQLVFSDIGTVVLKAVAEETDDYCGASTYIAVSCSSHQVSGGLESTSYTYDGQEHPFTKSVGGTKSCTPLYLDAADSYLNWTGEAPVSAGNYIVKLDLVTVSGEETVKFVTLKIKKREVEIKKLRIITKEWDGTSSAVLTGILTGVIAGDIVNLEFPDVKFVNSDAGKNKKVVVKKGGFRLSGENADQYELNEYTLDDLTGTINPKKITVKADDKTATAGDPILPLTYSVDGADAGDLNNIELSCKVTKKSSAGTYPIKIKSVAGNSNYKISKVPGTYTLLAGAYSSDSTSSGDGASAYEYSGSSSESEGTAKDYNYSYGGSATDSSDGSNSSSDSSSYDYSGQDADNSGNSSADDYSYSNPASAAPTVSPSPAPAYVFALTPATLEQVLVFDGMSEVNPEFKDKTLTINYWLTKDASVKTVDNSVKISINRKNWYTKLQFNTGAKNTDIKSDSGACFLKKNLTFYAKYKNTICKVVVKHFVCDKEKPQIILDGIRGVVKRSLVEPSVSQNGSFTFGVDALYGLAGKKTLSYKYVSDSSVIDVNPDWKLVKQNQITVDRDFSGYLAIRATDRLGNSTIIYTDAIVIDAAAPKVEGIENGGEYDGIVSYTVSDLSGVASVSVDGNDTAEAGEVHGGGLHTMTVIDTYGNRRDITFRCNDANAFQGLVQSVKALFGGV